jgi:hypothetical protein
VHVAPACAGSGKESDHFGSYVLSLSLHFCKRQFPGVEPMTSWSQGNSFTPVPGLPFAAKEHKLYRIESMYQQVSNVNCTVWLIITRPMVHKTEGMHGSDAALQYVKQLVGLCYLMYNRWIFIINSMLCTINVDNFFGNEFVLVFIVVNLVQGVRLIWRNYLRMSHLVNLTCLLPRIRFSF